MHNTSTDKIKLLDTNTLNLIAKALNSSVSDINCVLPMKRGMTNHSFSFICKGLKYIARVPGEGTELLINRRYEADVYKTISGKGICDDIIYINPDNGLKISRALENFRECNPTDIFDLKLCMEKLRNFHDMDLAVNHEFNLFDKIEFYEQLRNGCNSMYSDYKKVKAHVFSLKKYIDAHVYKKCLAHIDAVPDNFLFVRDKDKSGAEQIQLIDWEYAGMQDPHVDIAMFCIYALYDLKQINDLIDLYFQGDCPEEIRIKIYCYISAGGLLWNNWCEYKHMLGVTFGEYALKQYQFARDYSKIAQNKIGGKNAYEKY